MAHIEAFRAFRYDPARVPLQHVATQPYDKITPEMQERYYSANPNNLVRIILGKRSATDGPSDNVYSRAANFFAEWRRDGILVQDPQPSLYRYCQEFSLPSGSKQERGGFIALGKLEDYSAGIVHRHEQTLSKPKADRLDLLRATRAHLARFSCCTPTQPAKSTIPWPSSNHQREKRQVKTVCGNAWGGFRTP